MLSAANNPYYRYYIIILYYIGVYMVSVTKLGPPPIWRVSD